MCIRDRGGGYGFQIDGGRGGGGRQLLQHLLPQLGHKPALRRRIEQLKQRRFGPVNGDQYAVDGGPGRLRRPIALQQLADDGDV